MTEFGAGEFAIPRGATDALLRLGRTNPESIQGSLPRTGKRHKETNAGEILAPAPQTLADYRIFRAAQWEAAFAQLLDQMEPAAEKWRLATSRNIPRNYRPEPSLPHVAKKGDRRSAPLCPAKTAGQSTERLLQFLACLREQSDVGYPTSPCCCS